MRKKGNTVLAGLIICLLLVFLAAAGKLFGAYLKYQKGDVSYEKVHSGMKGIEDIGNYLRSACRRWQKRFRRRTMA